MKLNIILDRKNQKNKNNNVENVDKKEDDLFQSEEELISESN
jgi:hypothetical protein